MMPAFAELQADQDCQDYLFTGALPVLPTILATGRAPWVSAETPEKKDKCGVLGIFHSGNLSFILIEGVMKKVLLVGYVLFK